MYCSKNGSTLVFGAPNGVFYELLVYGVNHTTSTENFSGNVTIKGGTLSTNVNTGALVL